jgi:glycosyltransferase involved in cell wall biosynthesis
MICLDLTAAAHEKAGLGRYTANLARALLALGEPLTGFVNHRAESRLAAPLSDITKFSANLSRKPWRLRAAVSYFGGPSLDAALPGVTLFHATEHLLPYLTQARSVITLHDVAYLRFPQHHLWQNRLYLTLMVPRFLRRADAVICVSEATRRDALHFYRLAPAKVHVVTEGVEPPFAPIAAPAARETIRAKYRLPQRFILHIGTLEPRKNLKVLLEAYAVLRPHLPEVGLVLAGGKGWLYQDFFTQLRALGLEPHVTLTGYVPDADLPALLNCAEVFAFPSVFEGFGLPPLEAMACGVPVICSDASSLPEVVGDAGILLNPADVAAWGQALTRLLGDPALRADLGARGQARARQFTWEHAAKRTRDIYRALAITNHQ